MVADPGDGDDAEAEDDGRGLEGDTSWSELHEAPGRPTWTRTTSAVMIPKWYRSMKERHSRSPQVSTMSESTFP